MKQRVLICVILVKRNMIFIVMTMLIRKLQFKGLFTIHIEWIHSYHNPLPQYRELYSQQHKKYPVIKFLLTLIQILLNDSPDVTDKFNKGFSCNIAYYDV